VKTVEAYSRLAGVYDEIVVDPCHGRWARFLDELLQSDEQGVTGVLDVCCGTGLLAAELAARGYRVVGVDASAEMLELARTRADTDFHQAWLPDLPVTGTFDAAVSTFDGLNYLTPADFRLTLENIARLVRPGGWLVFDLHTDAMLAFTAANPVVAGEQAGNRFVLTSDVDQAARTCDTTIEVLESSDGEPFTETHRQYFHAAEDVVAALGAAGFVSLVRTDEYTENPVGASTLRATWIARREEVGDPGFEPGASALSERRSNQLS
jgi:SAM-dependent methyltransferase